MRVPLLLFEALLFSSSIGCQRPKETTSQPSRAAASAPARIALAPRAAGRFFRLQDGTFRQEYPRLPDTGEWRCAERDGVVWCAGGEAAAGVVSGPPDRRYRCGPRWGSAGERVCIDEHPDYPGNGYECAFEQELGIARRCRPAVTVRSTALTARAVPACWLDRDCQAGRCDRGSCACSGDQDCARGRCQGGTCVEEEP